ncbi:DUF262 domain-containing protein [Halomicroarcula sp. GCM10025324]|uniref:DUF262 domain-containing protein n=1 Tax=Haloarcula TaxID=2237 RepID=UPI0023E82D54|nr:DUF262 domain-containing protein [Halomicroarcula sp. ZS-22-S1]
MSDDADDLYSVFIDYEQKKELPIHDVGDGKVMKKNAEKNFDMHKRELGQVLEDQQFRIPEYQRSYSWRDEHHKQFWLDIEQFVDADLVTGQDNISDVFFSTMYFAVDKDSEAYDVIDGQQRLTTTHILLRVIMEHLQGINPDTINDDEVTKFRSNGIDLIDKLLYVTSMSGKEPRLELNKHDKEFFEALILGSEEQLDYLTSDKIEFDIHGNNNNAIRVSQCIERLGITEEEIASIDPGGLRSSSFFRLYDSHEKLLSAYEFYHRKISGIVESAEEPDQAVVALLNISEYIQHAFHVGEYVIQDSAPDFRMQIFEILNDRGVDLTKIDRIRSAVVNAFYDTDDKDDFIKKWEKIVSEFAGEGDRIDDYLSIYLSIVDEDVDTIGWASSQLTNAFDTRRINEDSVKPRLDNDDFEETKEFVRKAEDFVEYFKHITDPDLNHEDLNLAAHTKEVQEILVRLNDQQMQQWRPLVLALYYYTGDRSEDRAASFRKVIDTIEKLNFRRLLASERPNIFSEIFIDAVHEFGLSPLADEVPPDDVYAQINQYLITEIRSSTPTLFGDRFVDIITQAQNWNTKPVKLLFGRITHERYREAEILDRQLDMGQIDLEHVLPQTPIYDKENPVWLPKFFNLEENDSELADEIRRYLSLVQEDELEDEEEQVIEKVEELIAQRFIDDIANFLLLRDSDNISASNRPLAEKMPRYHENVEYFNSIYPNRYFTAEDGSIDHEKFRALSNQFSEANDDEADRTELDDEITEYFNSFWTYEAMKDRRVELLLDVLKTLEFETGDDEFGLGADEGAVRADLQEQIDEEFEKRLLISTL